MTTLYECVFAPVASTRREVIRNAQVVHTNGLAHYEALHPDAFRGWGREEIPILIDHDEARVAGKVVAVASHRDWMHGSFVLDGPYADEARRCVERSGKLSPCFQSLEKDPDFARPFSPHHYPYHWHLRARLNEISVLSDAAMAWYQGAKVTRVYEPTTPAPAAVPVVAVREIARRYVGRDLVIDRSDGSQEIFHDAAPPMKRESDLALAGQVFGHGEQLIRRFFDNVPITVR